MTTSDKSARYGHGTYVLTDPCTLYCTCTLEDAARNRHHPAFPGSHPFLYNAKRSVPQLVLIATKAVYPAACFAQTRRCAGNNACRPLEDSSHSVRSRTVPTVAKAECSDPVRISVSHNVPTTVVCGVCHGESFLIILYWCRRSVIIVKGLRRRVHYRAKGQRQIEFQSVDLILRSRHPNVRNMPASPAHRLALPPGRTTTGSTYLRSRGEMVCLEHLAMKPRAPHRRMAMKRLEGLKVSYCLQVEEIQRCVPGLEAGKSTCEDAAVECLEDGRDREGTVETLTPATLESALSTAAPTSCS